MRMPMRRSPASRNLKIGQALGVVLLCVTVLVPAASAQAAPGDVLWSSRSGLPGEDATKAVAATASGDFVTAVDMDTVSADPYIRVMSFTPGPAWLYSQDSGATNGVPDSVTALGLATDGGSFLAGWTLGDMARQDYLLTHFTAAGSFAGERTYDGPLNRTDAATAVAVDASGNCYVTGSSQSRRSSGDYDIVTVKYDAVGLQAWVKRFDADQLHDHGVAVAVRGTAVYVTGRSRRAGHGDDVVVLKYDATSGRQLWRHYYDDSLHRHDVPTDLGVTGSGVYVAGSGKQATGKPADALLLRYTFTGVRKWARYMGGKGADVWTDMEAGPDGLLRVTGSTVRSATGTDVMTASWRRDGTFAWRKTFSTLGVWDERAVALAVDGAGAAYVAMMQENATDMDFRVVAYDAAGGTLWFGDPFGYFAGFDDRPADIAVSATTAVVVGSSESGAGQDWLIIAYEK